MLKVGESSVQTKATRAQKPGRPLLFLNHSLPFLGCDRVADRGVLSVRSVGQTIDTHLPRVAAAAVESGLPRQCGVCVPQEQGSSRSQDGRPCAGGNPPQWRTTHSMYIQLEDLCSGTSTWLHSDRPVFKFTLSCFKEQKFRSFPYPSYTHLRVSISNR